MAGPSYPLVLPSYNMTDTDFNLINVDSYNVLSSGSGFGTEIAPPYWTADVSVRAMENLEQGYWDGFFASLRGSKESFLMYDANRPAPIKQPNPIGMTRGAGSGLFDGSCSINTIVDVRTVTVLDLPVLFKMTPGDYISFVQAGKYSLHMITVDTDSNVGDGSSTFYFEPYLNTDIFDATAKIWVWHAMGEFLLAQGSKPSRARSLEAKPVTFSAISRVQ